MCFAPEADFVTGVVVGALGVDAFRHVRQHSEALLAAIPVVLGVHSMVEAVVWWGLEERLPESLWRPALWSYLLIAFGVLPVLVPLAVGALEPRPSRWRVSVLTVIGVVVAIVLSFAVVRGPIEAEIGGRYLEYRVDLWHGGIIVTAYVIVTCGSMMISRRRQVRWFGGANLVAACVLAWLSTSGFISLWCFWAAVTSVAIALHLRHASRSPDLRRRRFAPIQTDR